MQNRAVLVLEARETASQKGTTSINFDLYVRVTLGPKEYPSDPWNIPRTRGISLGPVD